MISECNVGGGRGEGGLGQRNNLAWLSVVDIDHSFQSRFAAVDDIHFGAIGHQSLCKISWD